MRRFAESKVISRTEARADQTGNWLASYVAPKSLALNKVVLRRTDKGQLKARAYGTGYPDDVDWGEVDLQVCKEAADGVHSRQAEDGSGLKSKA